MRFFADRERTVPARAAAEELAGFLREAAALAPGPLRHGALAAVLVRAGELAQGIADAERASAGADRAGPGERAAMAATLGCARGLWASWRTGGAIEIPGAAWAAGLSAVPLPDAIQVRPAEGFALYGVYPETYAAAARALAGDTTVLGVRSIGTALAAMVAAGAGARCLPVTVRPVGDPFRREVRIAPALAARLVRGAGPFAVADEGPGLSGSSFVAAAEALSRLGVDQDRVRLFPSHPGPPGAAADPRTRAAYERLARHHVPFEALFLGDGPLALGRLAEDLVGPSDGPPRDLSAGAWRGAVFGPHDRRWPPSQGWRERRKFLVDAGGRSWLARFVGIGEGGERALRRARVLAAVGLVPAPAGLRHGFLVEPFLADALPLEVAGSFPRAALLAAVRRHLCFVAARFPAADGEGAPPQVLAEVAIENAREALGARAAEEIAALAGRMLPEVARDARPVEVDGKLQPWEWLVRPGGEILKADALDHHRDHALVGCQDALWDVAGATVELDLSPDERARLARAVRAAAPGAAPRCLPFYEAAYAAFEVGRWTLAAADPGLDEGERSRRRGQVGRLAGSLLRSLGGERSRTPTGSDQRYRPG
ncbi:MAG TPA: hypothetical protein VF894_07715 [Anaeromyxobacter sp.]